MKSLKIIFAISLVILSNLNESFAQEKYTQEASVYAIGRYGKKMADGSYLSSRHRTCSHAFLPMGSLIEITNSVNNRSEIVEVNGKSQTTDVELTHSVAHDLGFSSSSKPNSKVLVVNKSKESYFLSTEVVPQNIIITNGSQISVENLSVFNNSEPRKIAIKNKYEFSMVFPQYEPIKFDSVTHKFLIIGKSIVPKEDKQIYKEKIIML